MYTKVSAENSLLFGTPTKHCRIYVNVFFSVWIPRCMPGIASLIVELFITYYTFKRGFFGMDTKMSAENSFLVVAPTTYCALTRVGILRQRYNGGIVKFYTGHTPNDSFRYRRREFSSCWDSNVSPQIARFIGPTWGPSGSCRPQMDPPWAPRTLLSRSALWRQICLWRFSISLNHLPHTAHSKVLSRVWMMRFLVGSCSLWYVYEDVWWEYHSGGNSFYISYI